VKGATDGVKSALDSLNTKTDGVKAAVDTTAANVAAVAEKTDAVKASTDGITATLGATNTKLDAVKTATDSTKTAVDNLKGASSKPLSDVSGAVAQVQTAVAALPTRIDYQSTPSIMAQDNTAVTGTTSGAYQLKKTLLVNIVGGIVPSDVVFDYYVGSAGAYGKVKVTAQTDTVAETLVQEIASVTLTTPTISKQSLTAYQDAGYLIIRLYIMSQNGPTYNQQLQVLGSTRTAVVYT
jgi:hypothetical protein